MQYVKAKSPEAVLVLLTHDHGNHIGDYFEMLQALSAAGVPVKTVGQSDLMRKGLVPQFKAANLAPSQIVVNSGAGINFGGTAKFGDMTVRLVPAIHSTLLGFPSAGFIRDIGGVRAYLSGDTDLYGDLKMLGERYRPHLGVFCVGDGPFTMGPEDAARACPVDGGVTGGASALCPQPPRAGHAGRRGVSSGGVESRGQRDRQCDEAG